MRTHPSKGVKRFSNRCLANTSSFDEKTAVEFFEKLNRNLSAAEKEAEVKHHVALSIVGTDRLAASGYFHAKSIQEQLIKVSGIPYSIVQSTQFYEFLNSIAQSATTDQIVRLPLASFQSITADDVASILADIAVKSPLLLFNDTIEIAGLKRAPFSDLVRRYLKAMQGARMVVADDKARYFDLVVTEDALVPGKNPRLGPTTFESWLKSQVPKAV